MIHLSHDMTDAEIMASCRGCASPPIRVLSVRLAQRIAELADCRKEIERLKRERENEQGRS